VSATRDSPARVTPTDDLDAAALAHLSDGTVVEVLAWRPRGSGDTRYKIRAGDGVEGWLAVANLRSTEVAITPPVAEVSSTQPGRPDANSHRPFGQRGG